MKTKRPPEVGDLGTIVEVLTAGIGGSRARATPARRGFPGGYGVPAALEASGRFPVPASGRPVLGATGAPRRPPPAFVVLSRPGLARRTFVFSGTWGPFGIIHGRLITLIVSIRFPGASTNFYRKIRKMSGQSRATASRLGSCSAPQPSASARKARSRRRPNPLALQPLDVPQLRVTRAAEEPPQRQGLVVVLDAEDPRRSAADGAAVGVLDEHAVPVLDREAVARQQLHEVPA